MNPSHCLRACCVWGFKPQLRSHRRLGSPPGPAVAICAPGEAAGIALAGISLRICPSDFMAQCMRENEEGALRTDPFHPLKRRAAVDPVSSPR